MTTEKGMIAASAAIALLAAGWVGATDPVTTISNETSLDTRSISAVAIKADQDLDTRSYTEAWSPPRNLSTKAIKGTMILMR